MGVSLSVRHGVRSNRVRAPARAPPISWPAGGSWHYYAELQNALHAAVFGVPNFEAAKRSISRRGYLLYTDNRLLRNCN